MLDALLTEYGCANQAYPGQRRWPASRRESVCNLVLRILRSGSRVALVRTGPGGVSHYYLELGPLTPWEVAAAEHVSHPGLWAPACAALRRYGIDSADVVCAAVEMADRINADRYAGRLIRAYVPWYSDAVLAEAPGCGSGLSA